MTPEQVATAVAMVPHYKEPFIHNDKEVGYPFNLNTAVNMFGKNVIPEDQGIYHLFHKGRLVYVGMSKNLRGRLLYHLKDDEKVFDAVLWFNMKDRTIEQVLNKIGRAHV